MRSNPHFFLKEISWERQSRINGRVKPDPNAWSLWEMALASVKNEKDIAFLMETFEFARNIGYRHIGLSSEIYFAHPMRTAAMALLCEECQSIDFGIVGLLHNIFELSDLPPAIIYQKFNREITNQINDLTVNRELQWDISYKQTYYDRINSNALSCRVVKVFDKIDNMFLLGLNTDEVTRKKYLSEIEVHVLPMAKRDLPSVHQYLCDLFEDCKSVGFFGIL